MDKILTLTEIAEKLRVSKHTIQAWISPSSPNHRPEFANMARHAGRKTVFLEEEINRWLNQRKGALYSQNFIETSAYWRERFLKARGILKKQAKDIELVKVPKRNFSSGKLGLDYEPLLIWLTDSNGASEIASHINRAQGLVVPIPIVWWFLRRLWRNSRQLKECKRFFIEDNIFELAPMNENSLKRLLELPQSAGDLSVQAYSCSIASGAASLLTNNAILLKTKGLAVCCL